MDRDQSKTPSVRFADTVSRGRNRASVRECPEQWGIPKFAGGEEPTGLFARMRLLTLKEGGKGMAGKIDNPSVLPSACHRLAQ